MTADSKIADRDALLARLNELNRELEEIQARRAAISGQIEKAQADRRITGQYADPDWFRRAKGAHRHLGVEEQEVAREIGETNRRIRALNGATNQNLFYVAVREVVDDATWQLIVHRHEQLRGGDQR